MGQVGVSPGNPGHLLPLAPGNIIAAHSQTRSRSPAPIETVRNRTRSTSPSSQRVRNAPHTWVGWRSLVLCHFWSLTPSLHLSFALFLLVSPPPADRKTLLHPQVGGAHERALENPRAPRVQALLRSRQRRIPPTTDRLFLQLPSRTDARGRALLRRPVASSTR